MRFFPGLFLLLPLVSACAHAELIDEVNDRGELRIALEADTPPFNFKDDGQLTGFEVELGQLLATELDVRADFVVTDAADLLPGVESGKYDVAINHIAVTPELKDRFDISEPYSYSSAQLIVRQEEQRPLGALQALKGEMLGLAQGNQFAPQPLRDMADKQIDAAISEQLPVPYATHDSQLPIKEGSKAGPTLSLVIPFQKGNPAFQASLDNALQRIKADGRLMALSEKWFGKHGGSAPKP